MSDASRRMAAGDGHASRHQLIATGRLSRLPLSPCIRYGCAASFHFTKAI
jgi:hypothetical protein